MIDHHPKMWHSMFATSALLAVLTTGCQDIQSGRGPMSSRTASNASGLRLPGMSIAQVAPEAERAFRQHFQIDHELSDDEQLISRPRELDETEAQRVSDVLTGPRRRHRLVAELRVLQLEADVMVRCLVERQRLDTAERAAFAGERGDDRPDRTPIDRRGATSVETREEWVPVGRDRELEQEILAAIRRALTETRTAE